MGENDDGQEYIFLTLNYGNQSRSSELKGSFEVTEYSNYPIQVYYVDKSRQSHEVTFQCALSVQSGNASISAENGKKWLKTLGKGTAQIHASYLTLDIPFLSFLPFIII